MNERSFLTGFNTGNALDTIKGFQSWKEQETAKSNMNHTESKVNDGKFAYQCSLNATDKDLKSKYVSLSNLQISEAAIQQLAQSRGNHDYDGLGTGEIMCQFTKKNPKLEKINNDMLDNKIDVGYWAKRIGMEKYMPKDEPVEQTQSEEQYSTPSTWQNIAQGPLDTISGPWKLIDKGASYVAGGIAKAFPGTDNEKVDQLVQDKIGQTDDVSNVFGADKDSLSYILSNLGTDLGVTAVSNLAGPEVGIPKNAAFVAKLTATAPKIVSAITKLAPTVKTVEEFASKYPTLSRIATTLARGSKIGVQDGIIMRTLDAEGTDLEDIKTDAEIGGFLSAIGMGGNEILDRVKLSGLITSSKLRDIQSELSEMGGKFEGGLSKVSKWMDSWGINGTANQMANKLKEIGKTSKAIVDELSASIKKRFKSSAADKALVAIREVLTKDGVAKAGLESVLTEVDNLINQVSSKGGKYLPSDLRKIQTWIGDWLDPFTKKYGVVEDSPAKKGYAKLYRAIKEDLEKIFDKEGLGNIKALNNITAVSETFSRALMEKAPSEMARTLLPPALTTIASYVADGDIEKATKIGLATLAFTPYVRTKLSGIFRSLQGKERQTFMKWLDSEGKEVLSNSEVDRIVELMKADTTLRGKIKTLRPQILEEGGVAGAIKGGETVKETFVDKK